MFMETYEMPGLRQTFMSPSGGIVRTMVKHHLQVKNLNLSNTFKIDYYERRKNDNNNNKNKPKIP